MTTSARALMAGAALFAGPMLPTCMNVYHLDVERICDAEHRSGMAVKANAAGVAAWLQHSVASPEGVVLLNQLQAESLRDRAVQLRTEARSQSLPACPLADAYDTLASDDDYKTAIASLCAGEAVTTQGGVARLDVAYADDAERMRDITDWTLQNLKGAGAQGIVARMAQAPVKERSGILRDEASKLGIPTCALAATLDLPAPPSATASIVALPSFTVASVDAPQKFQHLVSEILPGGPLGQVVSTCYGPPLAKTPALAGNVVLRMPVDAKGKLGKVEDGGSTIANAAVGRCIANGMSGATLFTNVPVDKTEKSQLTPFKCTVTLALSPTRGFAPTGWPSFSPSAAADAGAPAGGGVDAGPDAGKKKKGVR